MRVFCCFLVVAILGTLIGAQSVPKLHPQAHKNSISSIHATRYGTTDMDHVLGVHFDSHNPNINSYLSYSFMNQLVGCFAKKRGQIRIFLIVFVIEYVLNTAIRYSKFGPCLEIITVLYNTLPDDKFNITTTLVENLNIEVK